MARDGSGWLEMETQNPNMWSHFDVKSGKARRRRPAGGEENFAVSSGFMRDFYRRPDCIVRLSDAATCSHTASATPRRHTV